MNKQTIWLIVIFGGLLAWLTVEYFDHLRTFEQQNLVKVQVSNVSCGGTRGSNITVTINNEEGSLEVTRRVCKSLSIGEQIVVLQSTSTDNYYWNEEPSKRFFWLYPVAALFIAYMIYSNRKKGKPHNKG